MIIAKLITFLSSNQIQDLLHLYCRGMIQILNARWWKLLLFYYSFFFCISTKMLKTNCSFAEINNILSDIDLRSTPWRWREKRASVHIFLHRLHHSREIQLQCCIHWRLYPNTSFPLVSKQRCKDNCVFNVSKGQLRFSQHSSCP